MDSYDILIVGGGIVGATLALALAQQTPYRIAILEASDAKPTTISENYHHRVSAIALSSQRIFNALKVWDSIAAMRISPFTNMQVWDAVQKGEISFDSNEIAEPLLGYIIENDVILLALQEKLAHYPQVKWIAPVKLQKFVETPSGVELHTEEGHVYSGKLAVAADGAHSWLRQAVNMAVKKQDYQQSAIVTTVTTSLPHQQTARQVFLPSGPLAFLPLATPHLSSIVWSLPASQVHEVLTLDDALFREKLTNAFEHRLGEVTEISKRFAFPLFRQTAATYAKSHVVLVGDAAHTMHPLAGQGVNMGLLDAASLAQIIADATRANRHFASPHTLRQYERWRRAENCTLYCGVDLIKQLFASDSKPLQMLRSIGLNTVDQMKWIKHIFTYHAVGSYDGLPRLANKTLKPLSPA